MSTIRIGITGYGNLGRGVELAISQNPDMELTAIFTRRDPGLLKPVSPHVPVYSISEAKNFTDKIDVMLLCGGSATDLRMQGPQLAELFHTVDSFDTHAKISDYFDEMDAVCQKSGHVCLISVGWDPGLFSLARLYFDSVLTDGKGYTFWGKGVSQGHSDALRRVEGVLNAVQYTVPSPKAIETIRSGRTPDYSSCEQHKRECYVVAKPGASTKAITETIRSMPDYFAGYETEVHFISEEELRANHSAMPHGGSVMRSGKTGVSDEQGSPKNKHLMELKLTLDSNPEFTASVLVAYARALHRLAKEGAQGAKTVLDIPPAYLSPLSGHELRSSLL